MTLLDKIKFLANKATEKTQFSLEYIPGAIEDLDQYKAINKELQIYCYGRSEEEALTSAKNEAFAYYMNNSSKLKQLFHS